MFQGEMGQSVTDKAHNSLETDNHSPFRWKELVSQDPEPQLPKALPLPHQSVTGSPELIPCFPSQYFRASGKASWPGSQHSSPCLINLDKTPGKIIYTFPLLSFEFCFLFFVFTGSRLLFLFFHLHCILSPTSWNPQYFKIILSCSYFYTYSLD